MEQSLDRLLLLRHILNINFSTSGYGYCQHAELFRTEMFARLAPQDSTYRMIAPYTFVHMQTLLFLDNSCTVPSSRGKSLAVRAFSHLIFLICGICWVIETYVRYCQCI